MENENQLLRLATKFLPECKDSSGYTLWLGIVYDANQRDFVNMYNGGAILRDMIESPNHKPNYDCITLMNMPLYEGQWILTPCSSPVCGICSYNQPQLFKVS